MQEEIQRASLENQMEALAVELEDIHSLVQSIESGFSDLGTQLCKIYQDALRNTNQGDVQDFTLPIDTIYLSLIKAVVHYSRCVKGFGLLQRKDCLQLLKVNIIIIRRP